MTTTPQAKPDTSTEREAFEAFVSKGSFTNWQLWQEAQRQAQAAPSQKLLMDMNNIIHDMVVAQQAAWIEWQHGEGAESAMGWVENGLAGPGHIPDEDEPYSKEAQAWYDANRSDPFPTCFCGRPSNQLWMGQGFCGEPHYKQRREELASAPATAPQPPKDQP